MTAKTPAQRQAASDARKKASGMKKVGSLWAYPEDFQAIRAHAVKLARKRAKQLAKEPKT